MKRLNVGSHCCRLFTLVTLLFACRVVFRRLLCCSLNKPIDAAAMDHNATLTPSAEAADTGTTVGGQTDQPKTSIRRDLGKLSTCFTISFALLLSSSIEI